MSLPRLANSTLSKYNKTKNVSYSVKMGGINYTDNYSGGDFEDSQNISTKRFPYLTTRDTRYKTSYTGVSSIYAWNELVRIVGTSVYYGSRLISGSVTAGRKQIATMNTKCIIYPDAKYFEIPADSSQSTTGLYTLKPLAYSVTPANIANNAFINDDIINFGGDGNDLVKDHFNIGDKVKISGSAASGNNREVFIKSISWAGISTPTSMYFVDENGESPKFTQESKTKLTITLCIPKLDYICESENRLWGCSNDTSTIYASALGNPTSFFNYTDTADSAYAVAVATSENFTGCTKLGNSVLFFKEKCIHKVLGSYPAEYQINTYNVDGLLRNCEKSMQVINDVLFYMGTKGINVYSGGTPSLLSFNFGNKRFIDGVGGSDGDSYFISCKDSDGKYYLFNYDLNLKVWTLEDKLEFMDFARLKDTFYMLDSKGDIYYEGDSHDNPAYVSSDETTMEWVAQFKPFYETFEGRKIYSKLHLRLEVPKGSYLNMDIRCDGKTWKNVAKIIGKTNNVIPVPVPIERCDKFEIKLHGKGKFTLFSLDRHYTVRSDN